MDTRSRGFGVPPPHKGEFTPGAQNEGLASGRAWLWLGLGFGLAVLLSPGRTPGDKLRRACQTTLWVWGTMILVGIVVLGTGALVDALVGWGG